MLSQQVTEHTELRTSDNDQSQAVGPDKRRIAETFGRAASTYDSAATLQQRVAARARLGLPELAANASILDMGCGTGNETIALVERYGNADITGLDLSEGMLAWAGSRPELKACKLLAGDIEELPFTEGQFDLVFSSLAIQWCECMSEVISQVQRVLKPGGWFVFSTLAEGSLGELNQAWRSVDDKSHVNCYESFAAQQSRAKSSELSVVSLRQHTETLFYPTVISLLREMKALGANTVVESQAQGLAGRRVLARLMDGYQPFATASGLPASYQVVYGVMRKPL